MAKALKAGGEVDSWCTKCRLFLNHRIIAMVGSKPARVECSTCSSHHNYRGAAPGEQPETSARSNAKRVGTSPSTPRTRGPTKAEQERLSREQSWEKAIAGRGVNEFKSYNVGANFKEGDLLRHKKFGDGLVTRVIDAHKVEVLFRDEAKTLAQGMT